MSKKANPNRVMYTGLAGLRIVIINDRWMQSKPLPCMSSTSEDLTTHFDWGFSSAKSDSLIYSILCHHYKRDDWREVPAELVNLFYRDFISILDPNEDWSITTEVIDKWEDIIRFTNFEKEYGRTARIEFKEEDGRMDAVIIDKSNYNYYKI